MTDKKGPISGYRLGWFTPTYKTLTPAWRYSLKRLRPIIKDKNTSEKYIELISGGIIEFWSLDDPDSGIGRKYHRVVIDEAAKVRHLQYAWEETLRPTLTDYKGEAWFLSTPRGLNYFHNLYQWGQDPLKPDWASWIKPTSDNPTIDKSEIEDARKQLPQRVFEQQYLARFIEDGALVFRNIEECATESIGVKREYNKTYVIGVDWGRVNDFTVISVFDAESRSMVDFDRFNQIDWYIQKQRLKAMVNKWQPDLVLAESNSIGEPLIEDLARDGMPVQGFLTTNKSKNQIIEQLMVGFENLDIGIIDDPTLKNEIKVFDVERLPSGMLRYSAPEGFHDDCVMSVAIGFEATTQVKPKRDIKKFASMNFGSVF